MLTRLSVKNFRLLRSVEIDIEPGKPIVLIGPNSSGKSSVLDAMEFLRRSVNEGLAKTTSAFGRTVETAGVHDGIEIEVLLTGLEGWLGEPHPPTRYGFSISSLISLVRDEWIYTYPDGLQGAAVQQYSRTHEETWIHNPKTQQREKIKPPRADQLILRHQIPVPMAVDMDTLVDEITSIQFYPGFSITPSWVRDPREGGTSPLEQSVIVAPQQQLDRRGLDLINALYSLHSDHNDAWEELLRDFCAEFPYVSRLEFPADPAGGRVALGWRDKRYPGQRMFGHQMSMGMVTYLCLLTALLTPSPAAAIAFDEPDAHLHPSALRRLVHLMERTSSRTTVFVATHSDRFLDFLSDPAASLRICEPAPDGVKILPVDRAAVEEWRQEYSLSQLRERGHLDPRNAETAEP